MPELPEVETVVRSLQPIRGRRFLNVEVRQKRVVRGELGEIEGKRIRAIRRRGKFIVIELDAGNLLVHLGMTGKLLWNGEITKHTHAIFTLDEGTLIYTDSRQFGRLEYSGELPERVSSLGPEPLEVRFEDFAGLLRSPA